jgi:hypothetical protein
MRQSIKAYRAECNVEFQFNAGQNAAQAITDVAHHRDTFTKRDVLARFSYRDRFLSRAVASLLERAERSGAIRPVGRDVWAVVAEEQLCDAVYSHAA